MKYILSKEKDQNGSPFVETSSGSIDFGHMIRWLGLLNMLQRIIIGFKKVNHIRTR